MTDYNTITRKTVVEKLFNFSFLNQFMLYLNLETITRDDYYLLLLVFSHNPQLEFKHIIFLIGQDEIKVSEKLKKAVLENDDTKWCLSIAKDFDYTEVV